MIYDNTSHDILPWKFRFHLKFFSRLPLQQSFQFFSRIFCRQTFLSRRKIQHKPKDNKFQLPNQGNSILFFLSSTCIFPWLSLFFRQQFFVFFRQQENPKSRESYFLEFYQLHSNLISLCLALWNHFLFFLL